MSSYYRPYFESQRERSDRERELGWDRRRYGRCYADDDAERGFREHRRDPYGPREWRESFEPGERQHEAEYRRGRFEQFEDWERPPDLSPRGQRSAFGSGYGFDPDARWGQRGYRGSSFGSPYRCDPGRATGPQPDPRRDPAG